MKLYQFLFILFGAFLTMGPECALLEEIDDIPIAWSEQRCMTMTVSDDKGYFFECEETPHCPNMEGESFESIDFTQKKELVIECQYLSPEVGGQLLKLSLSFDTPLSEKGPHKVVNFSGELPIQQNGYPDFGYYRTDLNSSDWSLSGEIVTLAFSENSVGNFLTDLTPRQTLSLSIAITLTNANGGFIDLETDSYTIQVVSDEACLKHEWSYDIMGNLVEYYHGDKTPYHYFCSQ